MKKICNKTLPPELYQSLMKELLKFDLKKFYDKLDAIDKTIQLKIHQCYVDIVKKTKKKRFPHPELKKKKKFKKLNKSND